MEPSPPDDGLDAAAVVDRVLEGDPDAFEAIVRRWQRPLISLAYKYCRDAAQAEDLAQEALVKVFRGLSKWRRESKFSTWMFTVALNHYRSEMRRHVPAGVELDEMPIAAGDRRREVEDDLRDEAIRTAVGTLPPKYRDVVIVYYFQERDLAETARIVELKEGTVKARLYRARKLLEEKLGTMLAGERLAAQEVRG